MLVITNNKKVKEELNHKIDVSYHDCDSLELLYMVRDKIHRGAVLRSHPLSGSIKPNENPYKSLIIDDKVGELDYNSLEIIENAIETFMKFKNMGTRTSHAKNADEDYSLIDFTLISSCF